MADLKNPALDYYVEFFEPREHILDVPVTHSTLDVSYLEASSKGRVRFLTPDDAARLARVGGDAEDEYVALQAYHGLDRINAGTTREAMRERHRFLKTFYPAIVPRAELRDKIAEFEAEHLEANFVVAVNIRTGNGGPDFARGGAYATRVDQTVLASRGFMTNVQRACDDRVRRLPRYLRVGYRRIFIVTDSTAMHDLLTRLPDAVARRQVFPPSGADHQFSDWDEARGYSDRDSVADTIIDMFLLARANALVYNNTNFNRYALTMTDYFSGNEANVEEYFLRGRARRAVGLARNAAAARSKLRR